MNVVLLDRDGTVIVDPPDLRVDRPDKIQLFNDSIAALSLFAAHDFKIIFITNQAGIEEGRLTEEKFWSIHELVLKQLAPSGAEILETYMNGEAASPHASEWRKPGPNMILQAAQDYGFRLADVYMVGDNQSDIQAAVNAFCKGGILVKTAREEVASPNAVFVAPSLLDAANFIVKNTNH